MDAYRFDPETKIFTGIIPADPDPFTEGNYILPGHSTFIAPPEAKAGFSIVWNPERGKWEYEELAVRTQCTKYELVKCLQENFPELLDSLRTAYTQSAELQFYWNSVLDLDRDNADFLNLAQTLGVTPEQLDAIFAKIGA